MKKRAYLMLGLALVLAAATVLLAHRFLLSSASGEKKVKASMTRILVAKNRLNYGAIITREHLRLIQWPKAAVPEGAFTSFADVVRTDEHRVVLRRIEKDEPVLKSKVSGFGGRASLSAMISKDMRAATIRVNDVNGVAGFVLPGDRVDVMITHDSGNGTGRRRGRGGAELRTDLLLQNVRVLGIDQDADDSKEKPAVAKSVTVEVKPHQAQKLILAQQVGTLSLSLRNVNNSENAVSRTIRLRDLRFGESATTKPKSVSPTRSPSRRGTTTVKRASSVKITRGLKASEYEVIREPGVARQPPASRIAPPNTPVLPRDSGNKKSSASPIERPRTGGSDGDASAGSKPIPLYRSMSRRPTGQDASSASGKPSGESIQ
jgi:pilus assembly protein CpaB